MSRTTIDRLIINTPYTEAPAAEWGGHKRIAVKIVDDWGIESMKIMEVGE